MKGQSMFTEFFTAHPLKDQMIPGPYSLYPPAEDRAAWEGLDPEYKKQIRALANAYAAQPYPMRRAVDFLAFTRTGSRRADEDPYFFRRRKLCAAVLACCLDETAEMDDVVDGIWCICEETSWVISAHNVNPIPGAPAAKDFPLPDMEQPYIDLFSAQTAMILALTSRLLEKRLDAVTPMLCRRVHGELMRRVIVPFMERDDFWWMGVKRKNLNNWTPWIVSNIMISACALDIAPYSLPCLLERACGMLDRWLRCVPEDGGCDEGAAYWNMAGGALLDCLEVIEHVTGGQAVFWAEDKLKNILTFPRKAEIGGGWFMNFADCDARPFLSGERLQYAGEKLGDAGLTAMGNRLRGTLADQLSDVPHFSRLLNLLFHPAAGEAREETPESVWLPDLQVRLVRRGRFTLCCKGGHNGESHNHNDVGSFMLYKDCQPLIVDAGNMVYTAKTFSGERYTLWNVCSAYHNVPMVGGCEQRNGSVFAARNVRCLPDGLALDIAGAYGKDAGIQTLDRELRLTEAGLTVADDILLEEEKPVTWVLMLRHAPVFGPAGFTSGPLRAEYDAALAAQAEEIPVTDPRMARSFPGSLWRVTLTASAAKRHRQTLRFRPSKEEN